jgi:3',5'-cyclic-AMP phosphodiesterase
MQKNTATCIIAQISDFHVGRTIAFPSGSVELYNQLLKTVSSLNRLDPQPDLVMVTGDLVNHRREQDYRQVKEALDRIRAPYRIAAGNHDRRKSLIEVFSDHPYLAEDGEFIHYTVEELPLRIIVLDTLEPGTHYGLLCDRRLQWLDERLAEQPKRPTMIVMHHPPFSTGMPYPDSLGLRGKEGLAEVLKKHHHIEAVTSGHTHRDACLRLCGTVAYTVPSCSFSYKLELHDVDDLDPLLEPAAYRLFRWDPTTGLVSHLAYVDRYEFGLTEGVPAPPEA